MERMTVFPHDALMDDRKRTEGEPLNTSGIGDAAHAQA